MHTEATGAGATGGADPRDRGLSRRAFLLRSGTVVASGILAAKVGGLDAALAHEGDGHEEASALPVWAATRAPDGRYLALAGDADHPDVAELEVAGDGTVRLGSRLGVRFPEAFAPVALLATPGQLLVGGAAIRERESVVEHYGQEHLLPQDRGGVPTDEGFLEGTVTVPVHEVRPSLGEVTAGGFRESTLEREAPAGFGVATALAALPGGRLAVLVEGAADREQAYNDITRLAEAGSDGRSWRFQVVASGLGEGRRSHVASTGRHLYAATVDQTGQQAYHRRGPEPSAPWTRLDAGPAGGPLLALAPRGDSAVEAVVLQGSDVVRMRHGRARSWEHAGTLAVEGDKVVGAVAVSGTAGELLALGQHTAALVR